MPKGVKFTLDSLKQIDQNRIGAAFDEAMAMVVKDCADRPLEEKAREVQLKFKVIPKANRADATSGKAVDLEECKVYCEITTAIPTKRTKVYTMDPKHDGSLTFNPDLPDEPEEETLYDDDERQQDEPPKDKKKK